VELNFDFDPLRQGILTVLCLTQVAVNWLAGDRNDFAWRLGVIAFPAWAGYIAYFGEWGMVPFVLFVQVVYLRNLLKSRRERRLPAAPAAAPRERAA
jgi:hypothetical protein